jgi:hypothetical protein
MLGTMGSRSIRQSVAETRETAEMAMEPSAHSNRAVAQTVRGAA